MCVCVCVFHFWLENVSFLNILLVLLLLLWLMAVCVRIDAELAGRWGPSGHQPTDSGSRRFKFQSQMSIISWIYANCYLMGAPAFFFCFFFVKVRRIRRLTCVTRRLDQSDASFLMGLGPFAFRSGLGWAVGWMRLKRSAGQLMSNWVIFVVISRRLVDFDQVWRLFFCLFVCLNSGWITAGLIELEALIELTLNWGRKAYSNSHIYSQNPVVQRAKWSGVNLMDAPVRLPVSHPLPVSAGFICINP